MILYLPRVLPLWALGLHCFNSPPPSTTVIDYESVPLTLPLPQAQPPLCSNSSDPQGPIQCSYGWFLHPVPFPRHISLQPHPFTLNFVQLLQGAALGPCTYYLVPACRRTLLCVQLLSLEFSAYPSPPWQQGCAALSCLGHGCWQHCSVTEGCSVS